MPEEVSGESDSSSDAGRETRRWRRYLATARERAASARSAAEERRPRSRLYDTAFRVYERNRLLPASLLVGALASRIVVYLIPLLALLVFVFGFYDEAGGSGTEAARSIAGIFAEAVEDSKDASQGFRLAAIVAMFFAALYAANSLGRLVRRSHALVWGVTYRRSVKPWMAPVGVLACSAVGWLSSMVGSWSTAWSWELTVGVMVVEFAYLAILWTAISRVLPHQPAASKWSDFLPGAFLFAFGVLGLRLAMVVYFVPHSAGLSARYGSIGVALVMLTWAYWLGMIIVAGSELNVALFRSSRHGGHLDHSSGGDQLLASAPGEPSDEHQDGRPPEADIDGET